MLSSDGHPFPAALPFARSAPVDRCSAGRCICSSHCATERRRSSGPPGPPPPRARFTAAGPFTTPATPWGGRGWRGCVEAGAGGAAVEPGSGKRGIKTNATENEACDDRVRRGVCCRPLGRALIPFDCGFGNISLQIGPREHLKKSERHSRVIRINQLSKKLFIELQG